MCACVCVKSDRCRKIAANDVNEFLNGTYSLSSSHREWREKLSQIENYHKLYARNDKTKRYIIMRPVNARLFATIAPPLCTFVHRR